MSCGVRGESSGSSPKGLIRARRPKTPPNAVEEGPRAHLSDYMFRKLCALPDLHPEEVALWARHALAAGIPNRYVDLKFCLLWWERQFRGGATFAGAYHGASRHAGAGSRAAATTSGRDVDTRGAHPPAAHGCSNTPTARCATHRELVPAPRPDEDSYPQATEHQEVVGYLYDPSRDRFLAAAVGKGDPVVSEWGTAPPLGIERDVGAWDLTPTNDGITREEDPHDIIEVPPVVARRLKAEAQKRPGETIVAYERRNLVHDIPSNSTTPKRQLQVLEAEPGEETTGWFGVDPDDGPARGGAASGREKPDLRQSPGEINDKYLKTLAQLATKATAEKKPAPKRQRRRAPKTEPYRAPKLPQIVVVQERVGGGRRFGGL